MNTDNITTFHPEKRRGIIMRRDLYDEIVAFIANALQEGESVNLSVLITKSQDVFPDVDNISWYLYQVKLDLEARGFVRGVSPRKIGTHEIRLTQSGIKTLLG
jgi:hypothetical protein